MKRLFILLFALAPLSAIAQYNPEVLRTPVAQPMQRHDIMLPQVNGYNLYKADLHTHSIYSDGDVTPAFRVREAYTDGLDIIAITEHIEYRRFEGKMLQFLKGYTNDKVLEPINYNLIDFPADKAGIQSDLNYPVKEAVIEAKKFGILVIPGAEITREPVKIGHFNALFTTDNNIIYDADPLQSLRNARKQGALIQHNHPGWRRTSCAKTEFEVQAYNEGLIDGIEVANGGSIYTTVIDRALKDENLFIAANTDIHVGTAETYYMKDQIRNMTLILAKECTLEAVREALEAKRTIAVAGGYIIAQEQLLKDLFLASVECNVISTSKNGSRKFVLVNKTSLPFVFKTSPNANPVKLLPLQSLILDVAKDKTFDMTIINMFCGENKSPVINLEVK